MVSVRIRKWARGYRVKINQVKNSLGGIDRRRRRKAASLEYPVIVHSAALTPPTRAREGCPRSPFTSRCNYPLRDVRGLVENMSFGMRRIARALARLLPQNEDSLQNRKERWRFRCDVHGGDETAWAFVFGTAAERLG